jgi:creatinine amidohydrolase
MLKTLPETLTTGLHGPIPPARYWAYYTWQEIDAIARADRNATAVINVGAVEQHGPHLPLITDTLLGMEVLGAALARLPDDVMVLALPPTTFGKSVEHITFPGTLTFSGDTLRLVLKDLAASVARSGFTKLVLLGSHGGNVGTTDDYFRDIRMETDLRVFKIFLGGIGQVPGLVAPEEAAIAMHSGDSETSMVRHLAPELVHMDRAEGYVFGGLRPLQDGGHRQSPHLVGGEGAAHVRGQGGPAGPAARGDLPESPARDSPRAEERVGGPPSRERWSGPRSSAPSATATTAAISSSLSSA